MRTALVVGGAPVANQVYRLKSGIQIVIATTERLLDILVNHSKSCWEGDYIRIYCCYR